MRADLRARTITINGAGGDPIEAYTASPLDGGTRGGVVVIHHLPGYDASSKEMVRRFAALGYDTVMPNLFHRDAPGAAADDAAATARANGGAPDDRVVGDARGALTYLRALPEATGRVGVIGHCSGGRHAMLVATELEVDAVVDCYGAFVTRTTPDDSPVAMVSLADRLDRITAPVLGLFGAEDTHPSPDDDAELQRRMTELGKDYRAQVYDGAGHAFFAVDRPNYRPQAAVDGWQRIEDFFGEHVGAVDASTTYDVSGG